MTDRFPACLAFTWRRENDGQAYHVTKGDRGGPTAWGVTLLSYAAWRTEHGHPVTTQEDLAAAPMDELGLLYRYRYWQAVRADELPPGVDLLTYEFGVGSGPRWAVRLLQRVIGTREDGLIGPATIATAVRTNDRAALLDRLALAHLAYYQAIPEPGGWRSFGNGWRRRNADRLKLAQSMAAMR